MSVTTTSKKDAPGQSDQDGAAAAERAAQPGLAPFGLDASKPEFWQKGLKVIEGMIDELERADAAA